MKILLTGANRGLGKLVASYLSPSIEQLFITARDTQEMAKNYRSQGINFHKAIPFDLNTDSFDHVWAPFSDFSNLDAVIHIASPYIPKKFLEATTDEIAVITRCATNEVKFLSKISTCLNSNHGKLIVTSAILAIPGYRAKGLMSWYKSSLDAIAEILSHELPASVKVFNFNLGTFREDPNLVSSGDAIASDFVAQKIRDAALGELHIDGHEICLKAPNDDQLLENLIKEDRG